MLPECQFENINKSIAKWAKQLLKKHLTHSRFIYGKPVETRKPYSCYYMSNDLLNYCECHNYKHVKIELQSY